MTYEEWQTSVPEEIKEDALLPKPVAKPLFKLLTQIIRLLLTIIPIERGYKMREGFGEEISDYNVTPEELVVDVPMS